MVELKLTNVTPLHGTYREARFDDCRLYPNPRRNPIRLVVKTGSAPYFGSRLRVELSDRGGTIKVSEGYTDFQGTVSLSVDSASWLAFPVSASLRIFAGEQEIAQGLIEAKETDGLYPGDVRVFDLNDVR